MSSNLLNGISPTIKNGATKDGDVYIIPKKIDDSEHIDHLVYQLSIPKLESNRAFHIGFSRKAVSTSTDGIRASIKYIDDAGNVNYMSLIDCDNTKGSWTWTSGSKTIPSGMTPVTLYISSLGKTYGMRITNVTLSYDSPIVLAISEETVTNVKDGTNGTPGAKGADGISVASVVIQYYLSTSSTSMAGGSWSTDYPKWEPNKWVWIRQETTLSNGTKKYSDGKLWSNLNELYELETSNSAEIINTNDSIKSTVEQVNTYHSELSDAIKSNTDALDAFKANVSGTYATKSEIAQTSQSIQASIKKAISDSTYQTVSNVKLDESGLHVGTSNTQTESKIDGSGLIVLDADGNILMNVTTTQSMIQNLKVTEKVQFGAHQIQAYDGEEADGSTAVGTALLWIGDVK